MKLAFYGLSLTSSWGNGHATTYRGLLMALARRGHELDFFERDVDWYASHRDLPHPSGVRLHLYRDFEAARHEALRAAAESDAAIVGSYYVDAIPLLDALLARKPTRVCFYDIDTPITLEAVRAGRCAYLRRDQIPELDLYLSFTGGPVLEELRQSWGAKRVHPLYCACDETSYRPQAAAQRARAGRSDFSFMGTFAPDRQPKLERLFLDPARRLPRRRFRLAGSMYPDPSRWPDNVTYQSHVSPDRHPDFYASSALTLNLTRQAMVEAGYSPSIRLFEAGACGTAIVTDPWPGLEDFFTPGRDILVAHDTEQVVGLLESMTPERSAELGAAARARVLAGHTSAHRAAALESHVAEITA